MGRDLKLAQRQMAKTIRHTLQLDGVAVTENQAMNLGAQLAMQLDLLGYVQQRVAQRVAQRKLIADYPAEARDIAGSWMAAVEPYRSDPGECKRVIHGWLQALDQLHRLDGYAWSTLQLIVDHVVQDGPSREWCGWRALIASPAKLRQRSKHGMRYADVIARQVPSKTQPVDWANPEA